MFVSRSIAILVLACGCTAPQSGTGTGTAPSKIPALIIDGVNNHDWERTTAAVRATLERTGRFTVNVSTSPERSATREEWEAWRPVFSDYAVVISNFNSDCEREDGACEPYWSRDLRAAFEAFVHEGGGFVSVHAANNHAADWTEYNEMIAVGGWGGRRAGVSGSILREIDGGWTGTSPDEGLSGRHGRIREFQVIHDRPDHAILAGLPTEWMHAADELYASLRGPAGNVEVLAHANSQVTGESEPMLMLITYGQGRVFHIPMGHYNDESEPAGASLHCVGFQTALARGAEYAATGEVTIGVPAAFPGPNEPSVVAPEGLEWPM